MKLIDTPCRDCERKGCGAYHGECEAYQRYNKQKEEDRAVRYKNRELTTQLIDHRSKTIKKMLHGRRK